MGAEGQTALALAPPGDQQADHGEHRPGGTPCGLLPPYGGARRRGLAPATARCHGGGLLLRGLEPRGLRPARRPDRRGPHCPPVVCVGCGQGRDRDHEAIACLRRGGGLQHHCPRGWEAPVGDHPGRLSGARRRGAGPPGVCGASAYAPASAMVGVSWGRQGGGMGETASAVSAMALHTFLRLAAPRASRRCPKRASWRAARMSPGCSRARIVRSSTRCPPFERA